MAPPVLLLPFVPTLAADAPGVSPLVSPLLILILCTIAGIGTILLLPGRYGVAWRRIGAGLALLAGLTLFLAVGVKAETRPAVYFWAFAAISLVGSVRVITHPKPVYSALYFVLTVFATAGLFVLLWAEFMAVALVVIYAGAILVTYTFVIMLAADAAPPSAGGSPEEAVKDFLAEHDRNARSPVSAATIGFVTAGILLFVIFDKAPTPLHARQSLTDARYMAAPKVQAGATGLDAEAGAKRGPLASAEVQTDAGPVGLTRAGRPLGPRGDLYPANEQPSYANERGGIQALGIYLFTRQMVSLQLAGLILTVAMVGAIVIARKQIIQVGGGGGGGVGEGMGLTTHDHGGETFTAPFTPANDDPKSLPVHGTHDPRQKAYPQN